MSSAILYLAIVGIWAVVLVPRWLRPSQASGTLESHLSEPLDASMQEDLAEEDVAEKDLAEEDGEEGLPRAGDDVAAAAPTWPAGSARSAASGRSAGSAGSPRSAARARTAAVGAAGADGGRESPVSPGRRQRADDRPGPLAAKRRAGIVRARRLTLTTLIVFTAGAAGVVMAHLVAPWVLIPPAVMLAGCVLLLRAAAPTDAQRTRVAASRPARRTSVGAPAQAAGVPAQAGAPDAKIIDISARVSDQLYDQYADVRAVGD